eukprot:CAMPEP_0181083680 /NCGR_PEP_ID=MMETSP1071-20121207/4290_1 /TAXON_ID=35127 /ORGANISM="Thalassiosira sp., Strain NH16" /LENGTH=549 /DNA_ID=CAMNT_0023165361 /DNA_START=23 /DNA_END=1669 /DNA_ORIENTATION=+
MAISQSIIEVGGRRSVRIILALLILFVSHRINQFQFQSGSTSSQNQFPDISDVSISRPKNSPPASFLSSMNLTRDALYEKNYFYRAWMELSSDIDLAGTDKNKFQQSSKRNSRHLAPMEIVIRYIIEHSHQQLQLEWNEACGLSTSAVSPCVLGATKTQRRFVVASYSCPLESGNRLHRFMNGLLWGILTNRTLLWRYQDYAICEEYGEDGCIDQYLNRTKGPLDCDGIIIRSPWIPSYEEWKDKLGFASDHSDIVRAEVWDGQKMYDNTTLPYDGMDAAGSNNDNDRIRVVRTGRQVSLDPGRILTSSEEELLSHSHLTNAENLARLRSLRSEGVYFLYGMLFESLFTLDPSLDPPKELLNDSAPQTIFLHSRHSGQFQDTYTWPDQLCLQWFAHTLGYSQNTSNSNDNNPPTPCHVYLMSDRPKTVSLLTDLVGNVTHCTNTFVGQELQLPNGASSPSFWNEHGPRAGRGFWQDVALSIHARDGMIAFQPNRVLCRTSTALVREMVEFKRVLEHHYQEVFRGELFTRSNTSFIDGELSEFKQCMNPW